MVVSTSCTAQEHAVRVEGRGSERGGLMALKETRVGLNAGDLLPVKVEDLDKMGGRATIREPFVSVLQIICLWGWRRGVMRNDTYTANTGRCSCVLAVRSTSLVVWNVLSG